MLLFILLFKWLNVSLRSVAQCQGKILMPHKIVKSDSLNTKQASVENAGFWELYDGKNYSDESPNIVAH